MSAKSVKTIKQFVFCQFEDLQSRLNRERDRETERDRERQRETERDRERQTETERQRETERDRERHPPLFLSILKLVAEHKLVKEVVVS